MTVLRGRSALLALGTSLGITLALSGCEGTFTAPGGEAVAQILLQPSEFALTIGEARRIDVVLTNRNGTVLAGRTVTWASSAPAVVSVDDSGLVTALARGEATITAEVNALPPASSGPARRRSAKASVSVLPPPVGMVRDHTCAISLGARVYCWGRGNSGQLGDGKSMSLSVPTRIAGDFHREWLTVSSGAGHSCALDVTGSVACWGRGFEGQLGVGSDAGSAIPIDLDFPFQFRAITAGARHTCGLSARDAQTWCWGWNHNGQIGNGTTVTVSTPVSVVGAPEFVQISAGARHTCAVDRDGGVWCWGDNTHGHLGDGTTESRMSPVRIASTTALIKISAGVGHTCAIATDGALMCWGDNTSGQLGDGGLQAHHSPAPVSGGLTVSEVSAGSVHTCAVGTDQLAHCWGLGSFGRLGTGAEMLVATPVEVGGGAFYSKVLVGSMHGCAVTVFDTMRCWGFGALGQLGNGGTANSNVPVITSGNLFFARFDG